MWLGTRAYGKTVRMAGDDEQPMSASQRACIEALAREAGADVDDLLTAGGASRVIDELKRQTGHSDPRLQGHHGDDPTVIEDPALGHQGPGADDPAEHLFDPDGGISETIHEANEEQT